MDEQLHIIIELMQQQTEMMARLCQIQEAILIMMADDADPDAEPQSYLNGRAVS